jgi:hypothetical protein
MSSQTLIHRTTIPLHLQELFDMMDFIGSARPNSKPCFRGMYYVDSTSWSGALWRYKDGESQYKFGNDIIKSCCDKATQAHEQYVGTSFENIILEKMIFMRNGISLITNTYNSDSDEIKTVNRL